MGFLTAPLLYGVEEEGHLSSSSFVYRMKMSVLLLLLCIQDLEEGTSSSSCMVSGRRYASLDLLHLLPFSHTYSIHLTFSYEIGRCEKCSGVKKCRQGRQGVKEPAGYPRM